ncbi:DUF3099 domain-containing protein [Nocardioides panacisoli]|uniref:DUF3099 domain-containing protein n=1 Tax=Nocardioides panacisoli TaxID=627624 RepID=UPI001C62AEB3|nr:DUF3099 domain-containing protein [Nocardioides panacisoli]QYJ05003.1 DUF3099 domain-containing protein [Nocardioides panacisoli]
MARSRRVDADAPIRITTAGSGRDADLAQRQRRYVIAMGTRALCFVGAVVAGLAGIDWLWPILIAGAIFLPYVAVVMANATNTRTDEMPLPDGGARHRQLGSHER